MKSITIYVSTFSDRNEDLVKRKAKAEQLFHSGRNAEAQREFNSIRQPGFDYLKHAFEDMNGKAEPIVGMYQGTLEPSIEFTLTFDDQTEWIAKSLIVKRRLIAFGRMFSQTNVHLVDLYAKLPDGVAHGERDPRQTDVTYQKKLWIALKNVSNRYHDNFILLEEITRDAGIENLTLNVPGVHVLLYTVTGGDFVAFDQQCAALLTRLGEREMVYAHNSQEVVALTNYGDGGYGETHGYDEAAAYLDRLEERT